MIRMGMTARRTPALLCLLGIAGAFTLTSGECPGVDGQASTQLRGCLAEFFEMTDFSKGSTLPFVAAQYCAESVESEIRCAEELTADCGKTFPYVPAEFDNTLNVDTLLSSVKQVCSRVDTLLASHTCVEEHESSVRSCVHNSTSAYTEKLLSLREPALLGESSWLTMEFYKALCEYNLDVAECQQIYRTPCGSDVADTLVLLVESVLPPICKDFGLFSSDMAARNGFSTDTNLELSGAAKASLRRVKRRGGRGGGRVGSSYRSTYRGSSGGSGSYMYYSSSSRREFQVTSLVITLLLSLLNI